MKRFLFPISALLLAVLSVVLFGSSSVNAASSYDGLFQTTDNLVLSHSPYDANPHVNSLEVSFDWYSQIQVSFDRTCSQYPNTQVCSIKPLYDRIGSANNEGMKWLVSMIPGSFSYSVTFTDDPTAEIVFDVSNDSPRVRIVGDYFYTVFGSLINPNSTTSDDGISVSGSPSPVTSMSLSSADNGVIFLSTFPITYPDGYEGDLIPESYDPPLVNDSTPDLFVVSSVNGLITIRDRSFNTFDNVPFVCEDGLTPYIRYTLQDLDHYLIFDTGGFSPTVDYQFQLPVKNQIINYEFSGRYDCGENTEPSFPNSSSVQFQLDPLGGLKTDLFEECISQEFPFIHYEGCYENVMRMLNMLSFSSLKINGWTYNAQCRQLTVLGGWLGTQPGQVICPNFSAQVRNTVTPFIAFFLGLTMFGFLIHRKGGL